VQAQRIRCSAPHYAVGMLELPVGEELKRLRKEAGLTQRELARLAGVSQSLIARIESGTVDPRASTLRKILQALSSARRPWTVADVMHSPVITLDASEPVRRAIEVMEREGISQIPVLKDGRVVGCVYEAGLLKALRRSRDPKALLDMKVEDVMEEALPMLSPSSSLEEAYALLLSGKPAILVVDGGRIVGIVTKIDVVAKIVRGSQASTAPQPAS